MSKDESSAKAVDRPYIKEVRVQGLHGQLDVEMQLGPGLNVIYGKNGRGKTTMLHLMANLLELDFERFRFLQFRRIEVVTSNDDIVEIQRDESDSSIVVAVNGASTQSTSDGLSSLEATSLRKVLGGRATYLPAFRSVLERTRSEGPNPYRYGDRRPEAEVIQQAEYSALREHINDGNYTGRQLNEEAAWTAEKTLLCRQWFGKFVPIIRYPSIGDVEDALSEEWRRAQYEVIAKERRMFEETFVRVFRVSAGLEAIPSSGSNEGILQEISDLLEAQQNHFGSDNSLEINESLLSSARQLGSAPQPSGGVNKYLLEVYRQALLERDLARASAFKRTRDFENSINKFLDNKKLSIGRSQPSKLPMRRMVSVKTEAGHSYGLSALSSGERQIITMLYSASRTKFTSGMFLIDEPELSLHIDWQRIILRELLRQAPERQIIVCTHSPEVGAEHMFDVQDFEPRQAAKIKLDEVSDEDEEG